MKTFKKIVYFLDEAVGYVACAFIFANMLVVTYSVVMRLVAKSPIGGLTDIVSFLSAINAACALGYTEKAHGFIKVDFVSEYFPLAVRKVLHILVSFISIAVLGLVTWRLLEYTRTTYTTGTISSIAFLHYWPIAAIMCIGFLVFLLTTIVNAIDVILSWKGGEIK